MRTVILGVWRGCKKRKDVEVTKTEPGPKTTENDPVDVTRDSTRGVEVKRTKGGETGRKRGRGGKKKKRK